MFPRRRGAGPRRNSPSGGQNGRGRVRSNGEKMPHRTGVVAEPGADGDDGGKGGADAGDRASSGSVLGGVCGQTTRLDEAYAVR